MKYQASFLLLGLVACSAGTDAIPTPAPPAGGGGGGDKPAGQPNVLLILLDDMCDWAGYLTDPTTGAGHPQAYTPNLDALAASGVAFKNAYCTVPFSNPSRCALLTGLPPTVTGIYVNTHDIKNSVPVNSCTMMPEHFKNNGYTTVCAGKVFHTKPSQQRMAAMWDDMDFVDGGYGPWQNGVQAPQGMDWKQWEEYAGPDNDLPDVRNSNHVIDFLGSKHDKPFFVAMGVYRPHAPYVVPKRFYDRFPASGIILPEVPADDFNDIPQYPKDYYMPAGFDVRNELATWRSDGTWRDLVRGYLASVHFSDWIVGNILTALKNSDYADNTVVMLVGDNGFHNGQKFRFAKMCLWREACHVPMIVSVPGGKKNASVTNPVSLQDVYPTLSSLCGLTLPSGVYGNDISPVVANPAMNWQRACWSNYQPGNFVVHYLHYNYIRYANHKTYPQSQELYDISTDENEWNNLSWGKHTNADVVSLVNTIWTAGEVPSTWAPPLSN